MFLNCSNRDILRKNGSAADATVAGLFCVGVINTQSMGLGGGFLLTYYEKSTGKAYTLNAREAAPGAAYEDMYHGDQELMEKGKKSNLRQCSLSCYCGIQTIENIILQYRVCDSLYNWSTF